MSFSLISSALAAPAAAAGSPSAESLQFIIFLVVFVLFFYFILWRPQSKRAKEQQNLLANLVTGDEVVTSGGILGKIEKISGDFIVLMVADNVSVTIQKSAIGGTVPKGTIKSL